jgi:hypothetical protein
MGKYAKPFYITIFNSILGEKKGTSTKKQNTTILHLMEHISIRQRIVESSCVFFLMF